MPREVEQQEEIRRDQPSSTREAMGALPDYIDADNRRAKKRSVSRHRQVTSRLEKITPSQRA